MKRYWLLLFFGVLLMTGCQRQDPFLPEVEPVTVENIDRFQEIGQIGYGELQDVRLTPDEKQVVATTSMGIYWFDAETLEELKHVPYDGSEKVWRPRLSPTTEYFAYIEDNNSVRFAETATGDVLYSIEHEYGIWDFWFPRVGDRLFIQHKETQVWDTAKREWTDEIFPVRAIDGTIKFSDTGLPFVSFQPDGTPKEHFPQFFDDTGAGKNITATGNGYYPPIAISGDGKYIAFRDSSETSIQIVDTEIDSIVLDLCLATNGCASDAGFFNSQNKPEPTPCPCRGIQTCYSFITYGGFTHDNRYLLLTSIEECRRVNYLYRFDMMNGELLSKEEIHRGGAILPFSDNNHFILWGDYISLYNIHEKGEIASNTSHFSEANWIEFSPDNQMLGASSEDGYFRLYDMETGQVAYQRRFFSDSTIFSFLHNSNGVIFSNFPDDYPSILNLETYEVALVSEQAMCSIGNIFVTSDDQLLYLYNWRTLETFLFSTSENQWKEISPIRPHPFKPELVKFAKGSFQTFTYDGIDLTPIDTIPTTQHNNPSDIYFGRIPDGTHHWGYFPDGSGLYFSVDDLLYLLQDGEIIEIDVSPDGGLLTGAYAEVVFSPDGSLIFVSADYDVLLVYESESGNLVGKFPVPHGSGAVDISSDGKYLALSTLTDIIHIWGVPVEE